MTNHELWQAVLGELELNLSKANFTTWFRNTGISSFGDEQVVISVPNTFTKAWLEKKYNDSILKSIRNVSGNQIRNLSYRVDARPVSKQVSESQNQQSNYGTQTSTATAIRTDERDFPECFPDTAAKRSGEGRLNPKYTFDTFVVGKGNELANAAAAAVAEKPGIKYNPLFVYGGVGLGKTHILQAIGNEMTRHNPDTKVMYVTCEKFTNDFISAIKHGHGKEFKDNYRNVDLLLIDDIQFLTGKDGTQEEFFHTFNTLHEANKQVVLTSDRPPKQIPALEHRLVSRFEWGMTVDISSPDLETRIAILETKCKERNYDLDREIIHHIATVIQSNVRELEGALNKIIAFHQFKNIRPTLEAAKSLLSSFGATHSKKSVTPKTVLDAVSGYFDVSIQDMLGPSREKKLAFPRQVIMFLMREETSISYPNIGKELGNRDHSTAMHACDKIRKQLEHDTKLRQDIELIRQRMFSA
ncbi:chromosomal replication initiator protein DnaA [Candidatus Uhrbacteria bacterium]|nr:chromosomal replication initiator protein DnaA [Candidatus Uhrbacteria bacterium]